MSRTFHSPAFADPVRERQAGRFGLFAFLASEGMLFGAMIVVYLILRFHYHEAFAAGSQHLDRTLGTLNTAVLLTSSLFMAIAVETADADSNSSRPQWALLATAALGAVFLGVKGWEYLSEIREGLFPILGLPFRFEGADPQHAALFFDMYLALTGLHAVHLISGIALVLWVALGWTSTEPGARSARLTGVGLYWHFIDVIWVFLFPILYLVSG